jgi:hypothetical protein
MVTLIFGYPKLFWVIKLIFVEKEEIDHKLFGFPYCLSDFL